VFAVLELDNWLLSLDGMKKYCDFPAMPMFEFRLLSSNIYVCQFMLLQLHKDRNDIFVSLCLLTRFRETGYKKKIRSGKNY
jgi:hypothetical protein